MRSYRMVTPKTADPATLRWVADHVAAIAADNEGFAATVSSSESKAFYNSRASQAHNLVRSLRARAGRIEGKRKRARNAR